MIKPKPLQKGDKVAIVSLSRGLLGMPFCKHELDLGIKRLKEYGLEPVFMSNALKDMDELEKHPELRANDLKEAFLDESIKGIICAIGGNDTYKTIPYLMEDDEFKKAVLNHPKIFTGFSDSTNNHLMLNKIGLSTFYGPCFLIDIAELDQEMLPYTKQYFEKFFLEEASFEITSSPVWYYDRENYSENELGKPRKEVKEKHGFETLCGNGKVEGILYGGCIESFYEAFQGESAKVYEDYQILPTIEEWKEKILFLETSDNKASLEELEQMLLEFKNRKILETVRGVIIGKPIDEVYYEEYKKIYQKVFFNIETPVIYNVNFGHAVPRCIMPYGCNVTVDYDLKKIIITDSIFDMKDK